MTARVKRYVLGVGALTAIAFGAYLLRAAHWGQIIYENERIESRSYASITLPSSTRNAWLDRIELTVWRLKHPGHARILSAGWRAEQKLPKGVTSPQQVYEEMGLSFPEGCFAREAKGGIVIAHYPSVLAKIEKKLSLQPIRTNAPAKASLPRLAEPKD